MIKLINIKDLPVKDLSIAGLIILVLSIIVANLYNPMWGFLYAFGNILTLVFLSWLYQDTWNSNQ